MNEDASTSHGHEASEGCSGLVGVARRQVEQLRMRLSPSDEVTRTIGDAMAVTFPGYHIVCEVHRGGQGVVYQAVQQSTGRTVALKFIRQGAFASASDRARFKREVDVLSRLNHPGIVSVIDSGSAGEADFLVMDFIDGLSLDEFMRDAADGSDASSISKWRSLSGGRLLEVFAQVCDAVHAAHLRGIIHRDLKPGNIRVDAQARPHVLDFGLARFCLDDSVGQDQHAAVTITGQFVGSVPWASPEQAAGITDDLDIRTDIYSLGVMLYQMVTGEFPYPVTGRLREVMNGIVNQAPRRPSAVRPGIDDELETIVLKCLHKEPARRYQSAEALAADIRLYLQGRPIHAKGDSVAYIIRKSLRRHWPAVTVAAGFLLLLTAGLIVTTALLRTTTQALKDKDEESKRASREALKAVTVNDFLNEMLASANPDVAEGREVTVRETLDVSSRLLDAGLFTDQPDVEASVRMTLGDAYMALSRLDDADFHYQRALELNQGLHEVADPQTAAILRKLSILRQAQDDPDQALALAQQAYEAARAAYPGDHIDVARCQRAVAQTLWQNGRREDAEQWLDQAIAMVNRLPGDPRDELATAWSQRVAMLQQGADAEQAERVIREALAVVGEGGSARPSIATARLWSALAGTLHVRRDFAGAVDAYKHSIELRSAIYGPEQHTILQELLNLAFVYSNMGDHEQGLAMLNEALPMAVRLHGSESLPYARVVTQRASAYRRAGRLDEAEADCREGIELLLRLGRGADIEVSVNRAYLATILVTKGNHADAESFAQAVLATNEQSLSPKHWSRGQCKSLLGEILTARGEFARAEPLVIDGYNGLLESHVPGPMAPTALKRIISLYEAWEAVEPGKAEQAVAWREKLDAPAPVR